MLLAGLALGWLGRKVHAARQRAGVVEQVRTCGGVVGNGMRNCIPRPPPSALERWCERLSDDLGLVRSSPALRDREAAPTPLVGLEYCTSLRQVSLWGGMGIDENVARLSKAHHLSELTVQGEVTDRGLAQLAGLSELHELRLFRFPASDAPLTVLPWAPRLYNLELHGMPVGREVLEQIGKYRELSWLTLDGTRLNDEGLAALPGLKKLTALTLTNNPIRGPGLTVLARLPALEYLDLRGTVLDGADLSPLVQCPKLRHLLIAKTEASVALRKARPDIKIE